MNLYLMDAQKKRNWLQDKGICSLSSTWQYLHLNAGFVNIDAIHVEIQLQKAVHILL